MNTISLEQTVAELVLERPARSRIFESIGIDYCCGGKKTLQRVCREKGVDPALLVARLEAPESDAPSREEADFSRLSLCTLIDNVLSTHHEYVRAELPRLGAMLAKVARVHGDKEPRLLAMRATFDELGLELSRHMIKEERILFPAIQRLEQQGDAGGNCFGSVSQPIAQMESEHESAGDALETLRQLSDGYTPPDWACNTYRALLDGLQEFEQDLHVHVHKENNILFPKAIRLELELRGVTV